MDKELEDIMRDPRAITCWGHPMPEQMEEGARQVHESVALWVWNDDYYEHELLMREIIEQAKKEVFLAWGL